MATLSDIQKQIAKLEKQAEVILKAAAVEAAKKARELIERHKLTAEDVGLAPKAAKAAKVTKAIAKPVGVPKYRDPKTGKTWTGTGKPPGWIAGAKNRDKFLIDASATTSAVKPAPAAAPVEVIAAPKKAAKKVVAATKTAAPKAVAKKAAATKSADAPAPAASVKKAVVRKAAVKKAAAPAVVVEAPAATVDAPPPAEAAT